MFDILVFIGRFQIFHNEHARVLKQAMENSKLTLVLVGSAGSGRTLRNPFTYEERQEMITDYAITIGNNFKILPLFDKTYRDSAWLGQVQALVSSEALREFGPNAKIGIIGADKDHSTQYLNWFPQWNLVPVEASVNINATMLRELWYDDVSLHTYVPDTVEEVLAELYECAFVDDLLAEKDYVEAYKKSWEVAPYPVKHVTVDSVVEQSGHILLVKRKDYPGKGKWAIPGGHLEIDESLLSGAIRELREETGLKVPVPVLKGSIRAQHTFDDPHRSSIGRVITTAFHFKLRDDFELPYVRGADDAEKAQWIPISEIREQEMYDDHYHIIQYFLGS